MTTFKYRGLSTDGQKISGVVKAYNEYEAVTQLRETCAVITHIQEVKEKTGLNRNLGGTRIKEKDLSIMCSQFSIILTSGLSIMRCVEMVAEQARTPELRASLLKVAEDVSGGYSASNSSARAIWPARCSRRMTKASSWVRIRPRHLGFCRRFSGQ